MADSEKEKFIKRATNFKTFNFIERDFTSTTFKEEIRQLFDTYYFGLKKDDPVRDYRTDSLTFENIQKIIKNLRDNNEEKYLNLFEYGEDLGFGSGEVALYYMVNSAKLGGKGSAGKDVFCNNGEFEVKAAVVYKKIYASNFKVGGTFSLNDIIDRLDSLRAKLQLAGNKSAINTSVLETMKEKAKKEYEDIENAYAKLLYDNYFGSHKVVFFNNSDNKEKGNILAIKKVKKEEIKINVLTSNTIKPLVLL